VIIFTAFAVKRPLFPMKPINVLFVCLGNICRSPLAEALFNHQVQQRGWSKYFYADSCGTSNYHIGDPPDRRTLANARKNGIEINHRGRQLAREDLDRFDYILAMDRDNYADIARLGHDKSLNDKLFLMRYFDAHAPGTDVPDPYYGGEEGFQQVFEILNRSVAGFLDYLGARHSLPHQHLKR
jgi:protein-tyrosine phosphatase